LSNILSIIYWLIILICSAICNDGLTDAESNLEKNIFSNFLKEASNTADFSEFNDDVIYTNLDSTPHCNEPSITSADNFSSSKNTVNTTETSKLEKTFISE